MSNDSIVLGKINAVRKAAEILAIELNDLGAVGIWETIHHAAEQGAITALLNITEGNISAAARLLDVNRNTLSQRIDLFNLRVGGIK